MYFCHGKSGAHMISAHCLNVKLISISVGFKERIGQMICSSVNGLHWIELAVNALPVQKCMLNLNINASVVGIKMCCKSETTGSQQMHKPCKVKEA